MKELIVREEKIKELERRVKELEKWIATHHCNPLPRNIVRVVGTPLPKKGELIVPNVYED